MHTIFFPSTDLQNIPRFSSRDLRFTVHFVEFEMDICELVLTFIIIKTIITLLFVYFLTTGVVRKICCYIFQANNCFEMLVLSVSDFSFEGRLFCTAVT